MEGILWQTISLGIVFTVSLSSYVVWCRLPAIKRRWARGAAWILFDIGLMAAVVVAVIIMVWPVAW